VISIKILKKTLKIIVITSFLILLSYIGIYLYAKSLDKLPINSANSFYMYDNNGNLFEGTNNEWINIDEISPYLINALYQ